MEEFRVAMMFTYIHNGPIFHYKSYTDVYWQWEQYQISIADSESTSGTISPVVILHGWQKPLWKKQTSWVSQWRQWACITSYLLHVASYKLRQYNKFNLCVNIAAFCSDRHTFESSSYVFHCVINLNPTHQLDSILWTGHLAAEKTS